MTPNLPQFKKVRDLTLAVLFAMLLWLPTLDSIFHLDKAPKLNEKRQLAEFPVWISGWTGARNFIAGLENYYGDHFGFRTQLIRWEHAWKRNLFHESSFPTVLLGKDDWLFYSGGQLVENGPAAVQFESRQLKEWQTLLESRRDWLASQGIRYVFVVPPDKHQIYPECLPEWMVKSNSATKLDQLIHYMKANSTVEILDLRPALLQAKKIRRTYLLTDTHWNQYGAFIGYQELIRTLGHDFPGMEPLSFKAFNLGFNEQSAGDLAVMLGQDQAKERDCPALFPRPPLQPLRVNQEPELLGKKWNQGMEPVVTENANQTGKAIVFRDSFAIAWIPFIGNNFNRVIYLWQQNFDRKFIEQEKPKVVIEEVVNRFFETMNPQQLKIEEGWN